MKNVTLTAHFDGEHIRLDEPFQLPSGTRLLAMVVPESAIGAENQEMNLLSKAGLARAYDDDEPNYPTSLIRKQGSHS